MASDPQFNRIEKLKLLKENARENYSSLWHQTIQAWNDASTGDQVWLTYAANYLIHSDGIHCGLDPFSMSSRVRGIPTPDFVTDLQKMDLLILSHRHNDHLDLELVKAAAQLPVTWVIPEHMLDVVFSVAKIDLNHLIIPKNGQPITFRHLTLTPFDSLHFHGSFGVHETGYLIETGSRRWLFPGDVRDFSFSKLPNFGTLDGIFAHLWLGKACANLSEFPKLEEFCQFFSHFDANRLILTHLYEYGRDERDLWDESHVEVVSQYLHQIKPTLSIEKALMGDRIDL